MNKKIYILTLFTLLYTTAWTQEWSSQDSIRLKQFLEGEEEIQLNPEAVGSIRFESLPELLPELTKPLEITEKHYLQIDQTLPGQERKLYLTLRPYNIHTKYNEDPIYDRLPPEQQRGMKARMRMNIELQKNRDKIKVGKYRVKGILTKGTTGPEKQFAYGGVGVGGLDLMALFTKKFWRFGKKALAVWKNY
ncbi:MAG: DUF4858 domain-containing protein [Bacteroides sp.]|nr:DUF4858 domain-containing protein [Bacteroides sp.]